MEPTSAANNFQSPFVASGSTAADAASTASSPGFKRGRPPRQPRGQERGRRGQERAGKIRANRGGYYTANYSPYNFPPPPVNTTSTEFHGRWTHWLSCCPQTLDRPLRLGNIYFNILEEKYFKHFGRTI